MGHKGNRSRACLEWLIGRHGLHSEAALTSLHMQTERTDSIFPISLQSRYGPSMSRIDMRRTVWARYAFPAMADGYFLLKGMNSLAI